MQCRLGCGACCIAPSISTPIPGMPQGKPAGVRCIQLNSDNLCLLFGSETRPAVCHDFDASMDVCGTHNAEAMWLITELEALTRSGDKQCN
ncbi:MAG: YkgJ family cysteine cluster protein [Shewanella sp.]